MMPEWSGSDPAVKGAVLGWMAIIPWRWNPRRAGFPATPALSALISDASNTWWTNDCYEEVRLLGEASGFTFESYVQGLHEHLTVRRRNRAARPNRGVLNLATEDVVNASDVVASDSETAPQMSRTSPTSAGSHNSGSFESSCVVTTALNQNSPS
ncbi:hypothetical protein M758_UG233600 [Ceratodon purpureus]|nr:hypothetical protein M758_UG233600 [Ceratodon purpureus]